MEIRDRLRAEFARRVERNPRYSQRAFARLLSLHHTTPAEVRAARLAEDARRVLNLALAHDFRPDCRWIAMKSGVDLDNVNRALHLLIHERRLVMTSPTKWTVNA